ncbi:putative decaprenylphosphoryl-beta-D-ribose oxidase [compost metagenome]
MHQPTEMAVTDVGRLMEVRVYKKIQVKHTEDISEALQEARDKKIKIAVSGSHHSQGGQTMYDRAIVLDMLPYHKVLNLDVNHKIIRVQSGITWEQIQAKINPHGLAIRVMQSSNIFTVGGSLSSNIHGRDPHEGPIIDTVESFRLMTAEGKILNVSRTEHAELFPLVIGGFGLFGIILDVDLRLTDNRMLIQNTSPVDYRDFPSYFAENVQGNDIIDLTVARLSSAPASFLTDMYVTNFELAQPSLTEKVIALKGERAVEASKLLFGLSRKYDWGKNWSWSIQKKLYANESDKRITRNNAMRPEIQFTEYRDVQKTDLLQEYFIPIDSFVPFVDGLREIVQQDKLNLVNLTVRYVPKNEEAVLSYAQEDCFALVVLFNHKRSPAQIAKLEKSTQRIVDLALKNKGSYYLTYQLFPTLEQFKQAYPNEQTFFQAKTRWDPEHLFMNEFAGRYAP